MLKGLAIATGVLLLVAVALFAWAFWKRPLALYAWGQRRALGQAGLVKKRLVTPGVTYWRGGSGPVVVLIHGAGDHAGTWAKVVPQLVGTRTLLVPDLPGHGESAPRTGPIPFATLLGGLDALLAAESPNQRVTLVGNSLGAWLASVWGAAHPERVERLVLVNGGPILGDSGYDLMPKSREDARKLMAALRAPESLPIPDFVLDDVVRQAATGPLARVAAAGDLPRFLMNGHVREIATPVELLWGEADKVVPVAYAKRMLELLPNARLTLLPRCGHVPAQERPEAFGRALEELLRAAPPSGARAAS